MNNKGNIYNYVVESINSILKNGIEYYADKNNIFYNRLNEMYEYINSEVEIEYIEDITPYKDTSIKLDVPKEVDDSIKSYMNKLIEIKISVLNLENDLTLYHDYKTSISTDDNNNEKDEYTFETIKDKSVLYSDDIELEGIEESFNEDQDESESSKKKNSLLDIFRKNNK